MTIHELNTKALTDPAYVAFDDGADTYKAEFNDVMEAKAAEAVAAADLTENEVAFTSGDEASPTAWSNVSVITTGSTLATLFNRISTMVKNVRYIWSLIGTTAMGTTATTITGAIKEHETDISTLNDKITGVITLGSNVTAASSFSCICEKRGNFVTVYIAFTATEDIATSATVATIPSGFRPPRQVRFVVYKTGGNTALQLNTTGVVNAIGAISNTNSVLGIVSYVL